MATQTLLNAVTSTQASQSVEVKSNNLNNTSTDAIVYSFQATVAGTGALTATITLQFSNDGIGWLSSNSTITLSGSTLVSDAITFKPLFKFYRANLTALTGTSAAVTATLNL